MMFTSWINVFRRFLDKPSVRGSHRLRLGIYVLLGVFMYAILVNSMLPTRYHLLVGQVSPVTITAPVSAEDTRATALAREAAMAKVPKQYALLPTVETEAVNQVHELFRQAQSAVSNSHLSQTARVAEVQTVAPAKLSSSTIQAMLSMNTQQLTSLDAASTRIVQTLLGAQFNQESMAQASLLIDRQLLPLNLDRVSQIIVENVVESVLRPNMVYQQALTQADKLNAAEQVVPVMIQKGDVIVAAHSVVTPAVVSRLKDVGLYSTGINYRYMIGFLLFMAISIASLAMYIERRPPRRRVDNIMLVVVGIVLLLMAAFIAIVKAITTSGGPASTPFLMPIALGSMLTAVLTDSSLAVVMSFYVSLLFGAALGFDFWYTFLGFVGSLIGAYSLSNVTHRGMFMRAGFFVAEMNVIAIVTMELLQGGDGIPLQSLSLHVGLGALNGVLSAVLTMGILPFFEMAFGILTSIHLLELSNPNNPLLRKVLMEAPGTYHHSLIVGNLAEAAAELVGADPLICRVGAYYHDVGKTRRPMFFVENQMTKENPHDKIAPSLSHLIITSHVSDGLAMLEKAGLPKPIRDICATHHGTTILWYFYNKALEQDTKGTVKVDDFRYPGPKPKTRECAIVMICDAVEAAVRAMARPTPNRVEGVIRKIVRDRLEDGQLDECDLTLQDLDSMVGAFMKTLKGIYHSRIEYPDVDKIRKEVAR